MKSLVIVTAAFLCVPAGPVEAGLAGISASARAVAADILKATGVQGGVIVHIGGGAAGGMRPGELAIALRAGDAYVVQGLFADQADVSKARILAQAMGVDGPVSFALLRGKHLPLADNMVNLLVAADLGDIPIEEVMRILAPRGIARIGAGGKTIRKPVPAEMDEWTHWLHGPDNNAVGKDMLVGPPRRMQWTAGPLWSRHHNLMPSVSVLVSSGGRVFYIVDEAPNAMTGDSPDKWALVARDAFNGVELWRRPITDWGWKAWSYRWEGRFNQPNEITKRLVAVGDRVYVTLGFNAPLVCLDAATGKLLRTFDGTNLTDEIVYLDGKLVLSINRAPQRAERTVKDANGKITGVGLEADPPVHKTIALIDANTGAMLWKKGDFVGCSTKTGPMERETHLLLSARDGHVFLLDRDAVVGLDLATGEQLWRSPRRQSARYTSRYEHLMSDMCTLVAGDGVVLLTQLEPIQKRIGWRVIKAGLRAFDAAAGRVLWDYKCGSWAHFSVPDTFIAGGLVWVHDANEMEIVGLDPKTGAEQRRISTAPAFDNGHHHRCYRNKATEKYLITSYRGYEFIDWQSGEVNRNHWVRGTCRLGAMPCNGLLYTTPHPCKCYVASLLHGMMALAPSAEPVPECDDTDRLVRGPVYDAVAKSAGPSALAENGDWPMYRHDAERSGGTSTTVPAALKLLWATKLEGGRLTAPTVAGGVTLAASVDKCAVYACAASSGERLWTQPVGGRVDSPPTLVNGLAIFGCRDGWVYCLRARDGALVWRFLAAPAERMVGAFGRLESAWPVSGTVLVHQDSACVAAGRSSYLDGGIMAWRLDPRTGRVLERRRIASPQNPVVDTGANVRNDYGVRADLLVAAGDGVYMRDYAVFGDAGAKPAWGRRINATGGMLDDTWFNRMFWVVDGRLYGETLVYDDQRVYSVRAYNNRGHGGFVEAGRQGYTLAASRRRSDSAGRKGKPRRTRTSWPRPGADQWRVHIAPRVRAMAVAGETLLCAATPDVVEPKDAWAAYEGRRGGVLMAFAVADGKKLTELKLPAGPVQDSIAVAANRVYLTTVDGRLLCFGN